MPKVAHLTTVHPVFDTRIFHKEAATLAAAGYDVVLIAVAERDLVERGVRVRALPGHARRWRRMTSTAGAMLRAALAERADLYHFHDPELIPVGIALKLAGRRVIYDVHDDVPGQVLSKDWIPPRLRPPVAGLMAAVERLACRLFDGVVVANPAHAARFPAAKTGAIRNLPRLEEFAAAESAEPYQARLPGVVYVGDLTRVRGAVEMVRAMALLPARLDARLEIAGRFSDAGLEAACRRTPGWERVTFLGWQSRFGVAAAMARARVGLVLLHPVPHYSANYPVKLFEYMASGLPVVASDLPLCREVVESAGCGLLVDPRDPAAIAAAVAWLLEHPGEAEAMGARGGRVVRERYSWAGEGQALLGYYARLGAPVAATPG
ncbi:MAG TPA: glycosyltransferase [Geminicoccaceae bacterium]